MSEQEFAAAVEWCKEHDIKADQACAMPCTPHGTYYNDGGPLQCTIYYIFYAFHVEDQEETQRLIYNTANGTVTKQANRLGMACA